MINLAAPALSSEELISKAEARPSIEVAINAALDQHSELRRSAALPTSADPGHPNFRLDRFRVRAVMARHLRMNQHTRPEIHLTPDEVDAAKLVRKVELEIRGTQNSKIEQSASMVGEMLYDVLTLALRGRSGQLGQDIQGGRSPELELRLLVTKLSDQVSMVSALGEVIRCCSKGGITVKITTEVKNQNLSEEQAIRKFGDRIEQDRAQGSLVTAVVAGPVHASYAGLNNNRNTNLPSLLLPERQ